MNKLINVKMVYLFIAILLVTVFFVLYKSKARQTKVSEFGKYQGYSEAIYNGNQQRSDYLTLSNGTRLAYDLILPTKKGTTDASSEPGAKTPFAEG